MDHWGPRTNKEVWGFNSVSVEDITTHGSPVKSIDLFVLLPKQQQFGLNSFKVEAYDHFLNGEDTVCIVLAIIIYI